MILNVGGTASDFCCLIPCCPGNSPSSDPGVKDNCVSVFLFHFFVRDYFSRSEKTQVSRENPLLSPSSQYPLLTISEAPEEGQPTPKPWPGESGTTEREDARGFGGEGPKPGDTGYRLGNPWPSSDRSKCLAQADQSTAPLNSVFKGGQREASGREGRGSMTLWLSTDFALGMTWV